MRIIYIECKECGLRFRKHNNMYVTDAAGNRTECFHPCEGEMAWNVIKQELNWLQRKIHYSYFSQFGLFSIKGKPTQLQKLLGFKNVQALTDERTGVFSQFYCCVCKKEILIDASRDSMCCPECTSPDILSSRKLAGKACPRCNTGMVVMRDTGMIT